jgi:hypothetical protein
LKAIAELDPTIGPNVKKVEVAVESSQHWQQQKYHTLISIKMLDIRGIRLQNEFENLEDNEDKIPLNVKYKVLNQSNILIQI